MMKKISKILVSIICIFALAVPSVFADINDVMFDLESLGVLEGMDKNADMDAYITRGEFAQLVVNALGHTESADTMRDKGYFSDVSATPYVGAINLLYELKVLSGTGVGTFSPDNYITHAQVGKMMVNVLGYSNIVNGNDLNAYYFQAGALGVYNNVNTTDKYVTRRDAYMMVYNSLNVDVMTQNFGMFGTGSYEVVDGNTLKSYLQTSQHHKLTKKTGIVTADRYTYLHDTEIGMYKTNLIQIDGELINCNFDVPNGLVGMEVDYYIEYTDGETYNVASIQPTSDNTVVEFNLDDFISASSNVLKYNLNDNAEKIRYDVTTKIVYNNRRERSWTPANIANYKNGVVKAIDNNEDGVYDVIYIYDYKDAVVERIYSESKQLYFANSQIVDGKRYLSVDDEKILVNII
ncbi:MAG: S-layer homology domain-containing protein, partial [Clostridia bacterium]|nr:S-layer homology domain-containing protein [Clostridia bacterium]